MDEFAPYQVQDVERSTLPTGKSTWRVRFLREQEREILDLTMDSVAFVALDLDRNYTVEDLIQLKEGGASGSRRFLAKDRDSHGDEVFDVTGIHHRPEFVDAGHFEGPLAENWLG